MTKSKQGLPQWQSDYLLAQRYLHSDQNAWDTLYRQAYPSVLHFLCTLYPNDRLPVSGWPSSENRNGRRTPSLSCHS